MQTLRKEKVMSLELRETILPGNENAFSVRQKSGSSLADLDAVHRALLTEPVTATLATMNKNGRPQLTPIWVSDDGERINLNTARGRLKDRNLRARPDASLCLLDPNDPYHFVTIDGTVDEIIEEDDPEKGHLATENIDAHAEKYMGTRPYPLRNPKGEVRVLFKLRPTKILTFGPIEG